MTERKNLCKLVILYVEDDKLIRELTTYSLELFEAKVIQASNGEEGIALYQKHQNIIDVVVTDIKMPKKDGLEMSEVIRQTNTDIPIIVTTGHEETAFLKQSIALNISSYVLKPIDIYQLKNFVLKAIEPKLLKQKLLEQNKQLQEQIENNKKKHQIMISQSRFALMGELINMIAHQWRQPLASIGTAAFNLQFKIDSKNYDFNTKEGQKEHIDFFSAKLKEIEYYVQNLTSTIDDFRNFYKKEKSLSKKTPQILLMNALKIVGHTFKEKNIKLTQIFEYNQELEVYANEIVHVMINILRNAEDNFIENSIKDKQIMVNSFEDNDYCTIQISDNGGGISPNIIENIFDPYFSTKKEKNGTGLGLYMSKIIVEQHHKGKLEFSNAEEGACFSIKIPIKPLIKE